MQEHPEYISQIRQAKMEKVIPKKEEEEDDVVLLLNEKNNISPVKTDFIDHDLVRDINDRIESPSKIISPKKDDEQKI